MKKLMLLVVIGLVIVAAPAKATLVNENFDSRTTGAVTTHTEIGAIWLSGFAGNIVEVVDGAADPFGGAGNKSLHIADTSLTGANPSVQYRSEQLTAGQFSIDLMMVDTDYEMLDLTFYQTNSYAVAISVRRDVLTINSTYTDGVTHTIDQAVNIGQVNSLVIDFDSVTDTLTGTLNGAPLTSGAVTSFGFYEARDYISDVTIKPGYSGAYTTDAYIDNVKLVPEPATMAILAFGSLIALKRRRS